MRRIALLILLWVCTAASAYAQSEFQLFLGGYNPGSQLSGTDFDKGALFGFRLGHSIARVFGTEFSYTYVKDLQDKRNNFDGRALLLNGNFLVQVPVGRAVPFATVGLGNIVGEAQSLLRVRTSFAWNAGGGLKIRRLAGPIGARFDVRYYKVPDGAEILGADIRGANIRKVDFDFAEVSGGLLITF